MLEQKYVVAVSGGVDSVVLLHMLATRKQDKITYIVAHFDHGIRADSAEDYEFVETLAKKYGFMFEGVHANLGEHTSEARAREARYAFLRDVLKKYRAEKIVTAHHQDDLLETMIINISRGTSPRGLAPMQGQHDILRPLMNKRKDDLLQYANEHDLQWREDSTNTDERFLRNYIRLNVMPILNKKREDLLQINTSIEKIYHDIDLRIANLLYGQRVLNRTKFTYLPYIVQLEFTRAWLMSHGVTELDRKTIERITVAIKTLPIGKKIDIDATHWLVSEKQNLLILSK